MCPFRKLYVVIAFYLLSFSCSLQAQLFNSTNGHYYEAVSGPNFITWRNAEAAAEARTFQGVSGHLATLTSASENAFAVNNFPAAVVGGYWLGGYQLPGAIEPAGGWTWVTGESWSYTNWDTGQPNNNDNGLNEDSLQFLPGHAGRWNDVVGAGSTVASFRPNGYIVEYDTPSAAGVLVSGTVTLGECSDPEQAITFVFRPKPSGTSFNRKVLLTQRGPNSGTFNLSGIPNGTYDIAVKGYCWLQSVLPNVVVNGDVSGLNVTLYNGDLNNDNVVDIADFGILVNEYNSQGDP